MIRILIAHGALLAWVGTVVFLGAPVSAANFVLEIDDPPNQGFNDPASVARVAGNTATTRGQQRINAFEAAAQEWGNRIVSPVEIRVKAGWAALDCTAQDGLLGVAGAGRYFRNFPGAPRTGTWYPWALANALAGSDRAPAVTDGHIEITFNSRLGTGGCLPTLKWDHRIGVPVGGKSVSLFIVAFHEIAHGLGFGTLVDTRTGKKAMGFNDAYMVHLEDHSLGKTWAKLDNAQRLTSMTDTGDLHWVGENALLHASSLSAGRNDPDSHILVHAPGQLDEGMSANHMDLTLKSGNLDDLMEPRVGPRLDTIVSDQILQDLGWPISRLMVRSLDNIDGLGAANDVAVLRVGNSPARHEVHIVDPSGATIREFGVPGDSAAIDMGVVSSFRDTSAGEIAVLTWAPKGRRVRVFINDASSGVRIKTISFPVSFPKAMIVVPSYAGTSADEIAIFTALPSGALKVFVKDAQSGAMVTNHTYPAEMAGTFGVVPSFGGTQAPEFVVAFTDRDTGRSEIWVRDATSGATLTSALLPKDFLPTHLTVVGNFGGSAANEVALLGVKATNSRPQVIVVDAGSGNVLRTKTYADRFHPRGIATIPDYAATPADELAILGRRAANVRTRLLVIDASSGAALTTTTIPQNENPHGLAVIPNLGGSAADDVLIVTTTVTDGGVRVFTKDARGQTLGSLRIGDGSGGGGGTNAFTFSQIQTQVFNPSCALSGCHNAASGQAGLVLAAGQSFGELVGISSTQRPAINRVQPDQPNNSYLIKKLRGDGDITGARMPRGRAPLSQATIDRIIGWINQGAPNN